MRSIKYITLLVTSMLASACTMEELTIDTPAVSKDVIQVVGRMTQFENKVVTTRASKDPLKGETDVTSMALAMFPIEDGVIGNCVSYQYLEGSNLLFNIDRSTWPDEYADKEMVMYVFANMPTLPHENDGTGNSLEYLKRCAYTVTADDFNGESVGLPETAFPMIGSVGDYTTDGDGSHFVLMPSDGSGGYGLPTVDGVEKDLLDIPMDAMYAKYSFIISVESVEEIIGNYAPRFTMSGYEIHNVPKTVDFDRTTNEANTIFDGTINVPLTTYAQGATNITFDFYIPERFVAPSSTGETFGYPFGTGDEIRDEDMNKRQRYKPLLAQGYAKWDETSPSLGSKAATYIKIKGTYRDHQEHLYDVSYDIYLGTNNYDNFDVERNTRYVNRVHIKGLDNSNDQTDAENTIALDHRVDVDPSSGLIINLRRETLLDAHFDIRPLRIRSADLTAEESQGDITVEILNPETATWLRMEHNNGTGSATATHCANGKRLYFTTDLVTNTLAGNTSINLSSIEDGAECIWIYADECTDVYAVGSDGKPVIEPRSATLRVTFNDEAGATKVIDYTISQSKLYPITITGEDVVIDEDSEGNWTASNEERTRNYYIESYEEYLYNFDAEDLHAEQQTQYEGMAWGLDGVQLSSKHKATTIDPDEWQNYNRLNDEQKNYLVSRINSYYDFYTARHDSNINAPDVPHVRSGKDFCDEIVATADIGVRSLDEQPQSAVEYCYNKNKRNSDGTISPENVVWYLPAVDEIEDIMVGAYDAFDGVFQKQDYWSCQPSYHRCYFFMSQSFGVLIWAYTVAGSCDYYKDDITRARSTRATLEVVGGSPTYSYNPSGVVIPETYNEDRTGLNGATVNFKVQRGYYQWSYNGGGNYSYGSEGEVTVDGVDTYTHSKWYITSNPIWPEFGETQEPGSVPRTDKNRIRCVRKMD